MTTPSLHADGTPRRVLPKLPATRALRYQLNVLAADATEVVEAAGGWLFDRAMAGWDVTVLLADGADGRALRILGARIEGLERGIRAVFDADERAAGLAVSAGLLACRPRLADEVVRTVRTGVTEVAVWGATTGLGAPVDSVQHRLSSAACIFKRHAMDAVGRSGASVRDVEALFRAGYRPLDSDLMPAG